METVTSKQKEYLEQPKERISGSEAIVRCLLAEGVEVLYGYPGGAIMPVYDELYKYEGKINHVLTRHEQCAAHAAQGYARISGKVGVAMATSGPGATNLITGIADAQIDSTPIVCITGQVPSHLLGSDAFQETDIVGISTPVTKWNHQITKASQIPEVIARAFYIARSGRPGPVLIDITKDAQFEEFDFQYKKCTGVRSYKPVPEIDENSITAAATLINSAKKPMIVWGQGVILGKAEEELKAVIEKTGIPSAWTILGASAIPTAHPLNVGMVGMHGNYAPNVLTNECDVLIAIGMRFDDRVTGKLDEYATQAKIVHFEIDPAEIDKNVKTDVAVLGDAKASLKKLVSLLNTNSHPDWLQKFKDLYTIEYDKVIKNDLHPTAKGLTMGEVLKEINSQTKGEAAIVTDVGQHQMIACRYADFNVSKSNITSGGLGTMGFALPAAIGAKMAAPEREVVAIIGDGGYQMTIQELGTIFQNKVPVKIVVLNNEFLGMVRQWQQLFFDKRYASTEMVNPNFVAIAQGYYIEAKKVTKRENLAAAVKEMIASDEPYFLEVCVEKENNVFNGSIGSIGFRDKIRIRMGTEKQLYTISIYTENNIGLLNRISAIFQRRHINIESINTSVSEIEGVSRFTILVSMTEDQIKKILGQIEKQVEVIKAYYHNEEDTIYQESCLFKIKSDLLFEERQIQNIIKESNARIVTVNKEFFVLEKSGRRSELEQLHRELSAFGIMQFVRSGRIAITKDKLKITEMLNAFKN